jgi:TonB-dependent SusC/RagA subfamily outer membrane receptor
MRFNTRSFAVLLAVGLASFAKSAWAQTASAPAEVSPRVVNIQAVTSNKAPATSIRITCKSSLPAGNTPLYIVDGKGIAGQDINLINPNDIDKVEVLVAGNATALYGSRAANGVVLITLKHPNQKYIYQPAYQDPAYKTSLDKVVPNR